MKQIFSSAELTRLSEYKYKSQGQSILEPYFRKFWCWLADQIPPWWSPNAITLVGLATNVATTLLLIYYSPDARQEPPGWAFMLAAAGVFAYQCLDAMDGEQGRRTQAETPLEDLFDHGCDAISSVFISIGLCISLGLGTHPAWLFTKTIAFMVVFYAAHWQSYCSGIIKFGRFDVTETQLVVVAIHTTTGTLGRACLEYAVPVVGMQAKWFLVSIGLSGAAITALINFRDVCKNRSTVAGTGIFSPLVPMGIIVCLALMIWQQSPSHIFENQPVLYLLTFGMAASKLSCKLVMALVCKGKIDVLDSSMIGPAMLLLNQCLSCVVSEVLVLWMCFGYCTTDLLHYFVQATIQICVYLDIYCFNNTGRPPPRLRHNTKGNGTSAAPKVGISRAGPVPRSAAAK